MPFRPAPKGAQANEGRRLFSEVLGTFFLVLAAVGGGMVNARFGGDAVPAAAREVAPALMVMAVILFMGTDKTVNPEKPGDRS